MIRVLMVEDDLVQVELTRAQSEQLKLLFELDSVPSAEAALAFLRAEGAYQGRDRPDVVLVDLNLPGMSGGELMAALRADHEFAALPLIAMSAVEPSRAALVELSRHARAWVKKPLGLEAWAKIVRSVPGLGLALVKLPEAPAAS